MHFPKFVNDILVRFSSFVNLRLRGPRGGRMTTDRWFLLMLLSTSAHHGCFTFRASTRVRYWSMQSFINKRVNSGFKPSSDFGNW